jgi:apolipoprotein N-acyltransferase
MTKSRPEAATGAVPTLGARGSDRRRRVVSWLDSLRGWRRVLFLLVLGAMATGAMPPFYLWPLLFIVLPGLVLMIDGTPSVRSAFWTGWWFGLGHFTTGFYWIANSMLTDPWRFGWMIPIFVGGLGVFMAIFIGFASALSRCVWTSGPARILALGGAWIIAEWLRSWVLSGFPWNLLGYSWAFSDPMMQAAAWTGSWGLSLMTVIAGGSPALLLRWSPGSPEAPLVWGKAGLTAAAGLALIGVVWAAGAVRLSDASDALVPGITLRLVQPAIAPTVKNDPGRREQNFAGELNLTRNTEGFDRVTHVIWAESAVPFLVQREPAIRQALAAIVPPDGILITGAVRVAPEEGKISEIWNSAMALDGAGSILATFDKFHLVPAGEYVPLRSVFPFISKITPGDMDFSAGPGPRTLHLPGLPPVGPLICYELIFPGAVVDRTDRPQWLLSLTNDAWFGRSTGPYQHFVSARFRAVEEGLPMVRAANAGISGVIDAYGRVQAATELNAIAVLDHGLPVALPEPTLFAKLGNWILIILLAATAILAGLARGFLR